ncbi:MAG: hypothetical protein LBH40_04850 [Alphaproteobacteria bacterium]|nr:hypothetical protein [Alphaproteobacteria bacterium]
MFLYKYFFLSIFLILLAGCGNIFANKKVYNNVFVEDIPEFRGMVIRNTLLEYFPNRNFDETQFVINVSTTRNSEYYLTAQTGFASRNRVSISVDWNVVYKPNGKTILSISNRYSEAFNIEKMGQSNTVNEQLTEEVIARSIARDIALKTFSLMLQVQKNPSLLVKEETEKIKEVKTTKP